ncbi:MAG TPA: cation:proton antiporter [Ktedonobacteraceae bacterium]|nr:cation:proton antiporter [Ktedonobacteraceae bacterium]
MLTGQILLQLVMILLVVQLFGNLSKRIGQQWVIGEILAGLALGPSLLGALWPGLEVQVFPVSSLPTLQTLGDIGLVLYMFSLGAQIDINLMLSQKRSAVIVSVSGIIFPLGMGALLGFFLYPGLAGPKATPFSFALLIGTVMAITAFPVLARLLSEKKMLGTKIGMLALTCASAVDVIAWCLLAFVVALIHAQGTASAVLTIGLTALFIGLMLLGVRPLFNYAIQHIQSSQLRIVLSFILLLLSAYTTNAIGIHPIFGAFLAGIILPRNSVFTAQIHSLDMVNNVLFLPLFFVFSGLRTQLGLIQSPALWLLCLLVLAVACVGKISGTTLSGRVMGETWREALSLGLLMNTRGLVELIVLNIGLSLGVLSPTLFAMLIIMAVVTTMMASPLLPLLGYRSVAVEVAREEAVEQAVS